MTILHVVLIAGAVTASRSFVSFDAAPNYRVGVLPPFHVSGLGVSAGQ